jgi:hypothetical protein
MTSCFARSIFGVVLCCANADSICLRSNPSGFPVRWLDISFESEAISDETDDADIDE